MIPFKLKDGVKVLLTASEIAALQPTPYELAMQDWDFPNYSKRIPVPINWFDPTDTTHNAGQKRLLEQFMLWWNISELPIKRKNGFTYAYCNEILPQHNGFLNSFGLAGQIEDIPVMAMSQSLDLKKL